MTYGIERGRAGIGTRFTRGNVRRVLTGFLIGIWLPVTALMVWYLLTRESASLFFPPLTEIARTFVTDFIAPVGFAENLLPSIARLIAGFALAVALGLGIGYFVGLSPTGRAMLMPVFDIFRSTPVIALIPVFIALFGVGSLSEILLIAWAAFWPIMLATVTGVASVDQGFRDVARSLRMTGPQRFSLMRLPAASPHIFAGVNIGISVSVVAMVAIELFNATSGIGSYLAMSKIRFVMVDAYAGAIAAGCVGFLVATLFVALERRVFMKWHYTGGGIGTA